MSTQDLFGGNNIDDFIENRQKDLLAEIDRQGESIFGISSDELTERLVRKFRLEVPVLKTGSNEIKIDHHEHEKGLAVMFSVPFEGDPTVLRLASRFSPSVPSASIINNEIRFSYMTYNYDQETLLNNFRNDLRNVEECFKRNSTQISSYNASISEWIQERINARKQKLEKDKKFIASLGFPLKK